MKLAINERRLGWCLAACAVACSASCAVEPGDDRAEQVDPSSAAAVELGGSPLLGANMIPSPEGSYFASVGALGTGCPAGSVATVIADDGSSFTMTFGNYSVELVPNAASVTRDCQLFIQLHSPKGLSYAVTSFSYSGVAVLDSGVSANLNASYYFQGLPIPPSDRGRKVLTGPFSDTFAFSDELRTVDQVWSPCGVERALNVRTRLQVSSRAASGSGVVRVATVEGNTNLRFTLAWRRCS